MKSKQKRNLCVGLAVIILFAGCAAPQKKVVRPEQTKDTYVIQPRPYVEPGQTDVPKSGPASKTPTIPNDISVQPGQVPVMDKGQVQMPLPSMKYVNDRIFEYGRKLDRWKAIDAESASIQLTQEDSENLVNCFVDLQKVLNGYNQLRNDMLQLNTSGSSLVIGSDVVMDLQKSDISFLESICGRMLAPEQDQMIDWEQREEVTDLPQLETLIERYTGSKEYEEVVQIWERIPDQQIERVHLRTKILYGNALMFLHLEEKAAEIYQQIVDEMSVSDEQRTDLLSLRKVLADLYTAGGNYQDAQNQYLNISQDYKDLGSIEEWSKLQLDILDRSNEGSPELVNYSQLLRNFLGFIPERDGYKILWQADAFLKDYPYSAVASNVDIIRNEARRRAEKWFNGFFEEVDRLAADKKYLDAIEKLETIPEDIISVEQKAKIKERNDALVLAEAVERETRKIEKMKELQKRWNDGLLQVDQGNYDEAIAIFTSLLQTEYYAKAQDKISDITLLAAKTDRRSAADLYMRYTKTADLELKKKLLTESRQLLKDILVKYPTVSIVDKVKGNIERVEQEMNSLDPALLPSVIAAEQEKAAEDEKRLPEENTGDEEDFVFSNSSSSPPVERPLQERTLEN